MHTVARATQTWLQSSWHVQVPIAWLEACVEFLQEEAGGVGRLSQQQINQQALDQWLLTDLRDLDHPVLPEGISQAQKTELSGIFCVQVDSLLDVSQPAYSQLQNWRGTDCANDQVSAVTQSTQRPWEAKPTRMLLLQVTDGVQSLEVMEYQPIPALSTTLRPGAKLQLKGRMVCRLGVLLLGPSNVKVLGGEVEDLVERNQQGRVLCRTLGLPEEEQQQEQEEVLPAQQGNQEVEDLELDDAELLASLETQEVIPIRAVQDSGYQSLGDISTQTSRSSSVRSPAPTASFRSEASARSYRNGLTQSSRGGPFQDHYHRNQQDNSDLYDLVPPERSIQHSIPDHNMTDEDFPDEDFDDLPLDELDGEMFEQSPDVSSSTHRSARDQNLAPKPQSLEFSRPGFNNSRPTMQKRDKQGFSGGAKELFVKPSHESRASHDEEDFMDLDAECFLVEVETGMSAASNRLSVQQGPKDKTKTLSLSCRPTSSSTRTETHQGQSVTSSTAERERLPTKKDSQSCCSGPAVTLTSLPFTYLSLLEKETSKQQPHPITIRVKAFIVTLKGKLTSSGGFWRVCATISDGTGYLDVELSDEVLIGLLGFSVAEKAALKRDPARRGELEAGMRRCQEELVDMCCVMTIKVESEGGKAVVTKAERVCENMLQELEQRVRDTKK